MSKVEIDIKDTYRNSKIVVDGIELQGVMGFSFSCSHDGRRSPMVVLDVKIMVSDLHVSAENVEVRSQVIDPRK